MWWVLSAATEQSQLVTYNTASVSAGNLQHYLSPARQPTHLLLHQIKLLMCDATGRLVIVPGRLVTVPGRLVTTKKTGDGTWKTVDGTRKTGGCTRNTGDYQED